LNLGDFSYYAPDRLLVLERASAAPDPAHTRVAIDYSSWDHARFTKLEFPEGDGFRYVEVDFPRVPVAILDGRVDAGIWHEMQTLIPPRMAGIRVRSLRKPDAVVELAAYSSAVLLVSTTRPELRSVIDSNDRTLISQLQSELTGLAEGSPDLLDMSWTV
jgi:hypothetical protein